MAPPPPRVLLYHAVADRPPDGASPMTTPLEVLEAHLRRLLGLGYRFVSAGEFAREWREANAPPPGVAVVTFDDGWRDGLTTATPLLRRLGIRATFYLCHGGLGKQFPHLGEGLNTMTEDEARALHDAGMELGSHTMTHRNVLELSRRDLRREFVESKQAVESIAGEPCRTIAYPTGRHDARVERAARDAGYELAFACVAGPWDRFAAPRWQAPLTAEPEAVARRLGLPLEVPVGPSA